MSEHEAGRELDALIAERVMGLVVDVWRTTAGEVVGQTIKPPASTFGPVPIPPIPAYSTDIAAAWEVVERWPHDDFDLRRQNGLWVATFFRPSEEYEVWAATASHAVCLAALKAVGA